MDYIPMVIPNDNIIIGDVHLCRDSSNLSTYFFTEFVFKQVLLDVIKVKETKGKVSVTFMGDLWHNESYVNTFIGSRFSKILRDICDVADIVIFLVGNHDTYTKASNEDNGVNFFAGISNVHIVIDTAVYKTENGDTVNMVSYCHDENKLIKKLEKLEDDSYVYMHNEIAGFVYKGENSVCLLNQTHLSKFKKVFNGHIHGQQSRSNLFLTGSLEQNNFGESGNKNYWYNYNYLDKSITWFENNISPKYAKVKAEDIKDKSPIDFDKFYEKYHVRVYYKNKEEEQFCHDFVKNLKNLLSIKLLFV